MTIRPDGRTSVREALRHGARLLAVAGSDEADLEAELLLGHSLGLDRVHLYQRLSDELNAEQEQRYQRLLDRRCNHEPTAYILGHREFYGLDFEVTPAAIIPRPETEGLVELVIEHARLRRSGGLSLVDVGVGCGAIAVVLARELPDAEITAVDISRPALDLARRNAEHHGVAARIVFLHGDLLEPLDQRADVIVANLPYVSSAELEASPPEIRDHEPRLGLDGGPDGLRLIERLLRQAPAHLNPGGALFLEIGDTQGAAASALARDCFPQATVAVKPDLAGLDRVLVVRM